jgi:hypothetical protein
MRYIAFSTIHGLSVGYGDTPQEARDSALAELQIRSARYIEIIDCGGAGPMIWQEMTPLELVRQYRPTVQVGDGTATERARNVRNAYAALMVLLLSGCGAGYTRAHDCRLAAGPEPYATGQYFGLAGALFMAAQPEHQQWTDSIDACMARSKPVATAAP